MKAPEVSFYEWQQQFATDEACLTHLANLRWPDGFQCPKCGHNAGYYALPNRGLYECRECAYQASVTSGTLFHSTKLPLTKWFWAIYWVSSDKGSVSALRLSKLLGVSWPTAHRMLRKLRIAMGHRDSLYRLSNVVELDDALLGGRKKPGKRGRGALGKVPILVACETHGPRPGFVAIEALEQLNHRRVDAFSRRRLKADQIVRTDALAALNSLEATQYHLPRVTPASEASQWLPWVHVVISNLRRFLLGTYHGVTAKHLQEYLNEFVYRFNRRHWEPEIPNRLLGLCLDHVPIKLT